MWANTIARRLVGRGGSSASLVSPYGRGSIAVKSVGCNHCVESAVCARNPVRQAMLFPQLVSPPCLQIRLLSSANEIALQPKPVTPIHQERHKDPPFSFAKMPFIDAFLWKMKKNPKLLMNKKIWSRRSMILPEFVNCSVRIHNGKSFIRRKITESMVGHKFGEFAFTRKRMKLKTNTVKKKAKKV